MPNIPGTNTYIPIRVWPQTPGYTQVQMMYLYFYKWSLYNFRGTKREGNTITVTLFDESSDVFEEVILKPEDV